MNFDAQIAMPIILGTTFAVVFLPLTIAGHIPLKFGIHMMVSGAIMLPIFSAYIVLIRGSTFLEVITLNVDGSVRSIMMPYVFIIAGALFSVVALIRKLVLRISNRP